MAELELGREYELPREGSANLAVAEILKKRIAGDFEECCGAGAEKKLIDYPLVLQCQWRQFVR